MITFFNNLRNLTFVSVFVRMMLSLLCGGIIGIEREYKRRPAGFRTHILICVGACITTLTGEFLSIYMHYPTDMSRLGAQVIAGIGFIGAGAIITTSKRHVRGLTTSAGLFSVAIIGLTFGAGFYEGGLIATILIFIVETLFSKLEYNIKTVSSDKTLYIEYRNKESLDRIFEIFDSHNLKIDNIEISRISNNKPYYENFFCAIITVQPKQKGIIKEIIEEILVLDDVETAEILTS